MSDYLGVSVYATFVQQMAEEFHADREKFHSDDIPVPWEFLPDYEKRAWQKIGEIMHKTWTDLYGRS